MSLRKRIEELLTEYGYPFYANEKSIITKCPSCSKPKHFYMFQETGFGTCMRCGWQGGAVEMAVMITGCSYQEAGAILKTSKPIKAGDRLIPRLGQQQIKETIQEAEHIPIPFNFFKLEERFSDAWNYVTSRGVFAPTIEKFDLRWSPDMKRVIIPVKMSGRSRGYQGRDITGKSKIPYLSPPKMSRSKVLMGYDQLDDTDFIILCEGPFDMLKLAGIFKGRVLCTMGKNISKDQLNLIINLKIKKIYLALDPDAANMLDDIAQHFEPSKEVHLMFPPDGRKDFGECEFQEIADAYEGAIRWVKAGAISGAILRS